MKWSAVLFFNCWQTVRMPVQNQMRVARQSRHLLQMLFAVSGFGLVLNAAPPPEIQFALAEQLAAKVQRSEIRSDEDGNVTGLIFINHQTLTKDVGVKPGITDADLLQLEQFPELNAVNFEAQPIGDRGLAVLRKFPAMKQAGFHYMAKAPGADASPDFITVIDAMRDLEILEIKHNFRMKAINVHKLKGPFPKVWRLVLDTPLTAEQSMHLIRLCPNVTDLQLHRTSLTDKQLSEIAKLLPKLEVLWLKPKQGVTAKHLTALKDFGSLRIFSPQSFKGGIPFENGWDALLALKHLKRLEISDAARRQNANAIESVKDRRPSLNIDARLTRSRNYKGL